VVIEHAPVSFGQAALITGDENDDFRFFAGFRKSLPMSNARSTFA